MNIPTETSYFNFATISLNSSLFEIN